MDFRARYRVKPRSRVMLREISTKDTGDIDSKVNAELMLARSVEQLAGASELLYAQKQWALLVILQALDAAGKDGTIKHVMSGVNPSGCQVVNFVAPTKQETNHDYLWRHILELPERGCIGIHNRSHYEEVIVTQVHPEILAKQPLPDAVRAPDLVRRRYREINRFERCLVDNGTVVVKFFLHLSKREQWRRLRDRMETPEKYWKLQASDLLERLHWERYMDTYQDVFRHTSTAHAPWHVIPADNKWFARLAVAQIINETLAGLKLHYPEVTPEQRAEWEKARDLLRNA